MHFNRFFTIICDRIAESIIETKGDIRIKKRISGAGIGGGEEQADGAVANKHNFYHCIFPPKYAVICLALQGFQLFSEKLHLYS